MAQSGSKKTANNLVSASCAAVLAVYVAGYTRTQSAADRFSSQVAERRVAPREQPPNVPSVAEFPLPKPVAAPAPEKMILSHPDQTVPAEPIPTTAIAQASTVEETPAEVPAPPPPPPVSAFAVPDSAPTATQPAEPVPPAAEPMWKDGTYTGWGYSRHGDIEASVVIEAGRIASATISQCRTRYSCSVIDRLPPQVAQRQSPNVDYVSGATQSADAFYGAVVAALNKAK